MLRVAGAGAFSAGRRTVPAAVVLLALLATAPLGFARSLEVGPGSRVYTLAGVGAAEQSFPWQVVRGGLAGERGAGAGGIVALPNGSFLAAAGERGVVEQRLDGTRVVRVGGGKRDASVGVPAVSIEIDAHDVVLRPDGGLLVADRLPPSDPLSGRVVGVSPAGVVDWVAGGGSELGDGGAAADARLSYPERVALLADGSVLIAEHRPDRLRRVGPDGTITTTAKFDANALAPTSDGGFLVGVGSDVRKVGPDGSVTTVARGLGIAVTDIAPLPSGDAVVAAWHRIVLLTAGGVVMPLVGPGRGGEGGVARNARLSQATAVDVAPDGGLLFADIGRIGFVAPERTTRLGLVAGADVATAARGRYRLPYRVSVPARLSLDAGRRGDHLAHVVGSAPAGVGRFVVGDRATGPFFFRLEARTADGQANARSWWAYLGGRLTMPWARRMLSLLKYGEYRMSCARVNGSRVDCEFVHPSGTCFARALILRRDGELRLGDRPCAGKPRRLRFSEDAAWMMQRAARRPATAEAARRLNQSLLASVAVDRDEGDYGIIRYHYLLPFARGGRRLTAEQKRLARACKAVECISGSWDRRGRRLALSGVTDEDDPWLGILARGSRIHAVKGGLRGLRGEDPAAVWAPDGRSLALEGDNSIRRLDLASGRNRRLALGAQPAWSVLGLIAFNRARGTYLMRPDGRNTRKIRGWGALGPYSWSPDGTRLAFCDRGDIATMSVDGRNVRHLTHGAAIDCKPAWSPDGRSIAFVRDEVEIWEVPTRGGNARRFTSRSAFDDLASGDGEALTILRLSWRAAG